MPYTIQIETALEKKLDKLKKKDYSLYQRLIHKIIDISIGYRLVIVPGRLRVQYSCVYR